MILSIGVDIVDVSRIKDAMENPQFVERILTSAERALIKDPIRVAGRWAAKEAIAKCFGGLGIVLYWHNIEIINTPSGVPKVVFHTDLIDLSDKKIHVSISHERGNAVGFAVLESLII